MGLDPDTAALLRWMNDASAEVQNLEQIGPVGARAASRALFLELAGPPVTGYGTRDISIPEGNRHVPARLYRPDGVNKRDLPVTVFFHGGGWAMGDLDSYDGLLGDLCKRSGTLLLSVDYRLAPENPFPAGLEDCLAATRWCHDKAADIGADAARISVMGDSCGGNLAAVVAERLHGTGKILLVAQFLLYPLLDISRPHEAYPSRMAFGGGDYLLNRDAIDTTTGWYLPDGQARDDPAVSPARYGAPSCLPPTVVVTAGFDPLRDEAARYASRLQDAGVPVDYRCFDGTIHAFLSFGNLEAADAGRDHLARLLKGFPLPVHSGSQTAKLGDM